MKKITFVIMSILLLIVLTENSSAQSASRSIEGNWLGNLEIGGSKLRLVLKVTKAVEGDGYAAKLDSPDQNAKDLTVDSIALAGDKVSFSAARFKMSYEGTINEKSDEIAGTLKQGNGSIPFVLRRIADLPKNSRPQDPQKPYPYAEEEVSYKNTKDDVKLVGTLSYPRGEGKHPAVILITGSGAQDRDSNIAGHRPFLVLADYLTRRGIAVLRVDDRGIGGSDRGALTATTDNFAGDVSAGIDYLKNRKEINAKQIGLIGHSEGGIIAPIVAARSKDVAFIVMLAGAGQSGAELIAAQVGMLQKASGAKAKTIAASVDLQKNLLAIITSEPDDKIAAQKINEFLAARKSKMNESELKEFAPVEANLKSQLSVLLSPWYRYFLAYNPRPTLEKIKIPVLALNGESDMQVAAEENLALISDALRASGNKNFTVKSFPKLNHLFQTSQTGMPSEYGQIEETISPQVLETISNWILKRTIGK